MTVAVDNNPTFIALFSLENRIRGVRVSESNSCGFLEIRIGIYSLGPTYLKQKHILMRLGFCALHENLLLQYEGLNRSFSDSFFDRAFREPLEVFPSTAQAGGETLGIFWEYCITGGRH